MKKTIYLIAAFAIAVFMTSCTNKAKQAEAAETEKTEEQLPDSVVAIFDEMIAVVEESNEIIPILQAKLTDDQRLVKPDYLLDLSVVNELVTEKQKQSALGILLADHLVAKNYGMDNSEREKAMAKLGTDLNLPVAQLIKNDDKSEVTPSKGVRNIYAYAKENNLIGTCMNVLNALQHEIAYIISNNPELYVGNLTDEEWQAQNRRFCAILRCMEELAKYDEDVAAFLEQYKSSRGVTPSQDEELFSNASKAVEFHKAEKESIANTRKYLLE